MDYPFVAFLMIFIAMPALAVNGVSPIAWFGFPTFWVLQIVLNRKQICATFKYWQFWFATIAFQVVLLGGGVIRESGHPDTFGLLLAFIVFYLIFVFWWYKENKHAVKVRRVWRAIGKHT